MRAILLIAKKTEALRVRNSTRGARAHDPTPNSYFSLISRATLCKAREKEKREYITIKNTDASTTERRCMVDSL